MKRLAVVCLFPVMMASAVSDAAEVMVLGSGSVICGTWAQDRRSNRYIPHSAWVIGYLRGKFDAMLTARSITVDPLRHIEYDGVVAWLDKYCADNPFDALYRASLVLSNELVARSRK